jgi:tubulin polyglutamylase TTLL9
MIDSHLNPWLLEVNAYPSLTASTKDDELLKVNMLDDALSVIDIEKLYRSLMQTLGQ